MMHHKIGLALFASGNGTNVQQIAAYFAGHPRIRVAVIIVNRKDAFVIQRAEKLGIPWVYCSRKDFYDGDHVLQILHAYHVQWIALAGFLWLIPQNIIDRYPRRIVNIHPALLPKFGGKGMYGHHVHEQVVQMGETETGISIHYVDAVYDNGDLVFQAKCAVSPDDDAHRVAEKIHRLEKEHYPSVLESLILKND